jgi:hypothetical protein
VFLPIFRHSNLNHEANHLSFHLLKISAIEFILHWPPLPEDGAPETSVTCHKNACHRKTVLVLGRQESRGTG